MKIIKGTSIYFSEFGYYNYIYPTIENEIILEEDAEIILDNGAKFNIIFTMGNNELDDEYNADDETETETESETESETENETKVTPDRSQTHPKQLPNL